MSNARDVQRAKKELADKLVDAGIEIAAARHAQEKAEDDLLRAKGEIKELQAGVTALRGAVAAERLRCISAQRGYIYRLEKPCVHCGQKWWSGEIGYDPDKDPIVIQEIAEGKLPPRQDRPTLADLRRLDERVAAQRSDLRLKIPNAGKPIPRVPKARKPRNAKARKRAVA